MGGALVDFGAAIFTGESRLARAFKVIDQIVTLSSVGARFSEAIVHVRLAQSSREARNAVAAERVDKIRARSSIETRISHLAVVDVRLAEIAGKTNRADALEAVDLIDARASILTAVNSTVINLSHKKYRLV